VPIGPHIADFVSFPLKCVIDLKPAAENEAAARTRAEKRAWLTAHGYRVSEVKATEVEKDVGAVLDRLASVVRANR
jgi:tRNA/rRNA methyltransferase